MKFLIFGAGAIGSVIGGFLANAGHEVSLIGREQHIKSIQNNGLRIDGIWGKQLIAGKKFDGLWTKPAPDNYDYLLITVKAYDTEAVAEQLKKVFKNYLKKNTILFVSMQNGIGNIEILEKKLGRKNLAGARVIFGAKINGPGSITVTVIAEPTAVGPGDRKARKINREKLKKLSEAMDSANLPSIYVDDILPYLWAKVLYNSALNPLSALLNKPYGELAANPFTKKIMDRVIGEAFTVAKRCGVKLFWKSADEYKKHFYNKLIPPTANHYASMLEDLKRKRTEIDAINGAIVRFAKKLGIPVPVNETLTNLVKAASL